MKVSLLDITDDALYKIGFYSSVCYDSNVEREACIRRAKHVAQKGHLACLRFATATFKIEAISRVCSHQMVRSKHLDFLQRSQRYVEETDPKFVYPTSDTDSRVSTLYQAAYTLYKDLLKEGVKREDARFVLPNGGTTELVVTGNFQAWLDFIKLRADKHAQWEIRDVAKEINNILSGHAPGLFNWMP